SGTTRKTQAICRTSPSCTTKHLGRSATDHNVGITPDLGCAGVICEDVTIGCVAGSVCFGNEITHILFRLTEQYGNLRQTRWRGSGVVALVSPKLHQAYWTR